MRGLIFYLFFVFSLLSLPPQCLSPPSHANHLMTQIDWLPVPVRLSHEHTDVRPIKVEEHLLRNESGLVIKKRKKKKNSNSDIFWRTRRVGKYFMVEQQPRMSSRSRLKS